MNPQDPATWPFVIVESPYGSDAADVVAANVAYANEACFDCLRRFEVPYASHLFFSPFLNDNKPEERRLGIRAGYAMWTGAAKVVLYLDLGMSTGMNLALEHAKRIGMRYETRYIR